MKLNVNPIHPEWCVHLNSLTYESAQVWLSTLTGRSEFLTEEEILCHDKWPFGWAIHKRSGARGKRPSYFVVYSHRCPQQIVVEGASLRRVVMSALIIALTNQEVLGGAYKKKGKL